MKYAFNPENMDDLQIDSRKLVELARGMMDSADWLHIGGDYCDTAEKKREIDNFAHEMADILVDVFNRIEQWENDDGSCAL